MKNLLDDESHVKKITVEEEQKLMETSIDKGKFLTIIIDKILISIILYSRYQ